MTADTTAAQIAAASRTAQGLPPTVTDRAAAAELAYILRGGRHER